MVTGRFSIYQAPQYRIIWLAGVHPIVIRCSKMSHNTQPYTAGLKAQPPDYAFETRGYEQFQMIYVMNGILFFETGGSVKALKPHGVLLLRAGSVFRLHTETGGYDGVYFMSHERNPLMSGDSLVVPATAEMRILGRLMYREAKTPGHGSRAIMAGLGEALAWLALRQTEKPDPTENYGRACAERARAALDMAVYSGQGAREILSGHDLSYRQLSRYFAAAFRVSPKKYQLQARLREAEQLLRSTNLSITAIAYELGFSSSQHFATQFTAFTGKAPTSYRNTAGENENTVLLKRTSQDIRKLKGLLHKPGRKPVTLETMHKAVLLRGGGKV
ncbi:MAG: hypothetical protein C0404_03030 [Verrucomicrobia bacterium]|nr:hypothetical protein [Verrucomicrobiota bacterium]